MPKVSRESASQVNDYGPIAERREDLEGTAVQFLTANQDLDGTLLMKGLPDDRCSSPIGATYSRPPHFRLRRPRGGLRGGGRILPRSRAHPNQLGRRH